MAAKFAEGTKIEHKTFGIGVVQPLFRNLHPGHLEEIIFVKFENPGHNCNEILQVDQDACVEVR